MFSFLGAGRVWFVNTLLFWNVISKFVCFFKCLLSLGNIPKAENCLTHSGDSLEHWGPGKEHYPLPLPAIPPPFYSWHLPFSPPPSLLVFFLLSPHLYSSTKVPRSPGVLIPYRLLGLGPWCWQELVGINGRPLAWLTLKWATSCFS